MAKAVMIQGTGSNVGKSLLVAGLCRAFRQRGLSVAPFKPQNMSNNAAVTVDGGEIGRAQALQAMAAGLDPVTDMNPVLLKPESETGASVIVQGQRWKTLKARDYGREKAALLPRVLESFGRLAAAHDLVIVEGAGSPAEVNLRAGDIANMGFAEAADVPVVLCGDIDRGGVIAQIVGTHAVLPEADRARIKGFLVNKFRGEASLFASGRQVIAEMTGWADLGLVPWFPEAGRLPAEDILDLKGRVGGALKIAVPRLRRIANFDDLDPLAAEPGVTIEIIEEGRPLPGDAAVVLLTGTKTTIADLAAFRATGWDIDLLAHVRRGGRVLGICGGYQMLGQKISDPDGVEGPSGSVAGLGLLEVETVMKPEKHLGLTSATGPNGEAVEGYEIHIGETTGPDCDRPFLSVGGRGEGARSADGLVAGTYLHGLMSSDAFRAGWLASLGVQSTAEYGAGVEAALDALAAHVTSHVDLDALLDLAETG
jgi:adenosylcobyric acid synthase